MAAKYNPRTLHAYLNAHPNKFFCDGCLVLNTGLPRPQVNVIARTLALFPSEFRRMETVCSQCRKDQECTQAISNKTSN